jgi:putative addiction module killer protein
MMVPDVLPFRDKIAIEEYRDEAGKSPYGRWLAKLNSFAAAKVNNSLERLAMGNVSNCKSVGGGVLELKIHFGPGYRVYFGRDGARLVLLLGGGTKARQSADIEQAQDRWKQYQRRKQKESKIHAINKKLPSNNP